MSIKGCTHNPCKFIHDPELCGELYKNGKCNNNNCKLKHKINKSILDNYQNTQPEIRIKINTNSAINAENFLESLGITFDQPNQIEKDENEPSYNIEQRRKYYSRPDDSVNNADLKSKNFQVIYFY
jgi:hypothetical protein